MFSSAFNPCSDILDSHLNPAYNSSSPSSHDHTNMNNINLNSNSHIKNSTVLHDFNQIYNQQQPSSKPKHFSTWDEALSSFSILQSMLFVQNQYKDQNTSSHLIPLIQPNFNMPPNIVKSQARSHQELLEMEKVVLFESGTQTLIIPSDEASSASLQVMMSPPNEKARLLASPLHQASVGSALLVDKVEEKVKVTFETCYTSDGRKVKRCPYPGCRKIFPLRGEFFFLL